jgi:hypothetical protein
MVEIKIITETKEEFEKEVNKYLEKGWFIEAGTYHIFEYLGLTKYNIMITKD